MIPPLARGARVPILWNTPSHVERVRLPFWYPRISAGIPPRTWGACFLMLIKVISYPTPPLARGARIQ